MNPKIGVRIHLLGAALALSLAAPGVASAAWWSTGTDVKSMCEHDDGGSWNPGNHGGISGWCMHPKPGREMQTIGTSNNYILHVRMDRQLYGVPPAGVMCLLGTRSGPNGDYNYLCPAQIN